MAKNPNKSKLKQPMKLTKGEEVIEQYSIPALENLTEVNHAKKAETKLRSIETPNFISDAVPEERSAQQPIIPRQEYSPEELPSGRVSGAADIYIPHPLEPAEETAKQPKVKQIVTYTEEDLKAAKDERKKLKAEIRKYWKDYYDTYKVESITPEMLATAERQKKQINKIQYRVNKINAFLQAERQKELLTQLQGLGLTEEQAAAVVESAKEERKPFQSTNEVLQQLTQEISDKLELESLEEQEKLEDKAAEPVSTEPEILLDISEPFIPAIDEDYPFEQDIFYSAVLQSFMDTSTDSLDAERMALLREMFNELTENRELYAYAKENYEQSDTTRIDAALWLFTHYQPKDAPFTGEEAFDIILEIFFGKNRNINDTLYNKYKEAGSNLFKQQRSTFKTRRTVPSSFER